MLRDPDDAIVRQRLISIGFRPYRNIIVKTSSSRNSVFAPRRGLTEVRLTSTPVQMGHKASALGWLFTFFAAIVCPPLVVFVINKKYPSGKEGAVCLSIILTVFGWLPGVVHAWVVIVRAKDKRTYNEEKNEVNLEQVVIKPSPCRILSAIAELSESSLGTSNSTVILSSTRSAASCNATPKGGISATQQHDLGRSGARSPRTSSCHGKCLSASSQASLERNKVQATQRLCSTVLPSIESPHKCTRSARSSSSSGRCSPSASADGSQSSGHDESGLRAKKGPDRHPTTSRTRVISKTPPERRKLPGSPGTQITKPTFISSFNEYLL